jgi:pyruvate dehydrogenase E2 component (dihydrolipoamide acetyltransferase)
MLARRHNVDLASLAPGSGPGGVITRSDVDTVLSTATAEPMPPLARSRTVAAGSTIAVRGVRARIAERMTSSRARIPDATCSVTADCTRLLEVRASLNEHASRLGLEPAVTPFSLLARFVVQALGANPMLNSTFDEEVPEIRIHEQVHLGIGTATERGLVVTVVRDAGRLGVHNLSSALAELSDRARTGSATPNGLQGSTFTISNFGALGLDEGIPIINHPEAAILGVGSIRPRPHVVDGAVVARPTAALTLAFDHRVCDGAEAGQFLGDLRRLIESPELALLGS